jgi:hypothetical protein
MAVPSQLGEWGKSMLHTIVLRDGYRRCCFPPNKRPGGTDNRCSPPCLLCSAFIATEAKYPYTNGDSTETLSCKNALLKTMKTPVEQARILWINASM